MNWQKIIRDLLDSGLTQVQIAEQCGTSQGYISDLSNGRRTRVGYDLGRALERLHQERSVSGAAA